MHVILDTPFSAQFRGNFSVVAALPKKLLSLVSREIGHSAV
jgi:hypothetical protein